MTNKLFAATAAGLMALTAGAAIAQSNPPGWDAYQAQQRDYQRQQSDYQDRREDYADQRAAYEAKREQYVRDQAAYDRRYGRGAYVRKYGEWRYEPMASSAGYGRGGRGGNAYDNNYYSAYRDSPCETRRDNRTVGGALIGALAGAALGSNIASSGVRTEGAVLGGLVGAGLGGSIGRSSAKCDGNGYWYSRDQTVSYREAGYQRGQRSGRYAYNDYSRRGCRLAPAPAEYNGQTEYRYVRVCPDRHGRYRITG